MGSWICNVWFIRKVKWADWDVAFMGAKTLEREVMSEVRETMFGVRHGRGKATTRPLLLLCPQRPEEFQTVTAHKQARTCARQHFSPSPKAGKDQCPSSSSGAGGAPSY